MSENKKEYSKQNPHWVEVRDENCDKWEKRIIIDNFSNGKCLCSINDDSDDYQKGNPYRTKIWNYWREIEEPKKPQYVPFDTVQECFDALADKWITNNVLRAKIKAFDFEAGGGYLKVNNEWLCFDALFKYWKQLDGTPCGKLKED